MFVNLFMKTKSFRRPVELGAHLSKSQEAGFPNIGEWNSLHVHVYARHKQR